MHYQSSIESSLEDHHETESGLHHHYFDNDSDCESSMESSSRCDWRRKSSGTQCAEDVSVESPWYFLFLLEEDLDNFSNYDVSDEDEEDEEDDSHHDNHHQNNSISNIAAVHRGLSWSIEERQLLRRPVTIESNSKSSSVHTSDMKRKQNRSGVLLLGTTTDCILHETDSLSFRRRPLSPRTKSDRPPGSRRNNKDQRRSSDEKQSPSKLNRLLAAKEYFPQFAVIEWDEEMLKRQVDEEGTNLSSKVNYGSNNKGGTASRSNH